jgi:hypothetical protein
MAIANEVTLERLADLARNAGAMVTIEKSEAMLRAEALVASRQQGQTLFQGDAVKRFLGHMKF